MSKYHAVRTNGYSSRKEAIRGAELELLERAGAISNLRKQPSYILLDAWPEGGYKRPLMYVGDFEYFDKAVDRIILEDVKGFRTPVYKIKKRLLEQLHGIKITEI